jgi:hypothetical protein
MSELVRPFDAGRDHWRGGEGVVILPVISAKTGSSG